MNASVRRFDWWHRDELQVFAVYVVIILFFGRSASVQALLFAASIVPLALLWFLRLDVAPAAVRPIRATVIPSLPPYSWDRSRLAMSLLSTVIVGSLFVHRVQPFIDNAPDGTAPLDLYWVLFLGWYALVWGVISVFLVWKWKTDAAPTDHRFMEGLVGSMFFFHGLPPRSRLVTFAGGFVLGGMPTAYALQVDPSDPGAMTTAVVLVVPVMLLIILGAWFASRWVGTTPTGEV